MKLTKSEFRRRMEEDWYGGKSLKFGKCIRYKLPEEKNDDDDAEGLQYFYNGRYHSQYAAYASFELCESGCSKCDSSVTFVTDLYDFVSLNAEYVEDYCYACSNCRRRKLDDADDGEDYDDGYANGAYNVDCNECTKECKKLNQGGLSDEVNYLDCQEAYEDEDEGLQIYSGVTCDGSGNLIIGTFYDDECTVKHSTGQAYFDFTYEGFQTVQAFCYNNDFAMEGDIYPDKMSCKASTVLDDGGRDEAKKICRSLKTNELTRFHKTYKFNWAFAAGILGSAVFCFLCGSYTYFVRHKEMEEMKDGLAYADHDLTEKADYVPNSESGVLS